MPGFSEFLAGVRVLDLSQYLPGPLATLILADMGAEVVKIEAPRGDPMREVGPRDEDGRPVFYHAVNGGKTVIRLDLKDPDGNAAFMEMVRTANVVVEGFRPGVMARLDLAYERLKSVNPALILCSISGYGIGGSLEQAAGHDGNYLSLAGVLDRNGEGRAPVFDPPVADGTGSLFAAIAILGALHGQRRTGLGCHVDLALADVAMPLQLMQVAAYGATGVEPKRGGTYLNGGAAYYNVYPTADGGEMMLGAIEPKFWRAFCETAGRPELVTRQFETLPQADLIAEVRAVFAGLTRADCERIFRDCDCCLTPVLTLGEALAHDHAGDRGLVARGPDGILQVAFPAHFDGLPAAPRPSVVFAGTDTAPDPALRTSQTAKRGYR